MPLTAKKTFFGDLAFEVCEHVYEPAEDSFLFAENLSVKEGERVLDMGTGSGILGILSAKQGGEVVAIDVNPYAVQCAKHNALTNHVQERMAFLRADLFNALNVDACFDVILFNAPYLPSDAFESESWLGRAWAGGTTGRSVIDRFISQVPTHLKQMGRVLLMQSNLADVAETQRRFAEFNMAVRVLAELALPFFEKLTLLQAAFDA